jgi:hypothetical protein
MNGPQNNPLPGEPLVNVLLVRNGPQSLENSLRLDILDLFKATSSVIYGVPIWKALVGELYSEGRISAWAPIKLMYDNGFDNESYLQILSTHPCFFTLNELADELTRVGYIATTDKIRMALPSIKAGSNMTSFSNPTIIKIPDAQTAKKILRRWPIELSNYQSKLDTDFIWRLSREFDAYINTTGKTNVELTSEIYDIPSDATSALRSLGLVKMIYEPSGLSGKLNCAFVFGLETELDAFVNQHGIMKFDDAINLFIKQGRFMSQLMAALT